MSSVVFKARDNNFSRAAQDPLLKANNSLVWVISARRGAGKSTMLMNVLSSKAGWRGHFDTIYFVSPTAAQDDKMLPLVEECSQDGNFYDEFDEAVCAQIFDKIKQQVEQAAQHKQRKPKQLLILDDCIMDMRKNKQQSVLNRMVVQSRHFGVSLVVTTQKYNALPTIIRGNMDCLSQFASYNAKELATVIDDLSINADLFHRMYSYATAQQFGFLHCNLTAVPPVFYKNFERIPVDFQTGQIQTSQ